VISKLEAKETKIGWHQGAAIEKVQVEAHGILLDAADMLLKLYNAYPRNGHGNEDSGGGAGGPTLTLVITDPGRAAAIAQALANRRGRDIAPRMGAPLEAT
jgi:hypothetical protein